MKAENLEKKRTHSRRNGEYAGPRKVLNTHNTQNHDVHVEYDYHLLEKVIERSNLKKALKRVESNKGEPGIDGMPTQELREYLKENWVPIKQQLLDGTYQPRPVRRVEIPKPSGGTRPLGIPTVLDRFIQQAIQQVLTHIFEPQFSNSSYGFRPKRSARQAVEQARTYISTGKRIVIDMDIEKFFDQVNHDILMQKIAKSVHDKRILKIIRKYLQAGVMIEGCCVRTEEGTPQGGPISPLLANIMLNDLDKELSKRGLMFVRYADDCNIYVASKRAAARVFASITKFIQTKLKLKVNAEKSAIDHPWKRKFLGFTFSWLEITTLRIAPKSIERFKERIRSLTKRNAAIAMEKRIEKLNEYLIGWSGYFSIAECKSMSQDLDAWIRRRLRMCVLKQWKRCKTKLQNMVQLGVPEKWAGCIAFSRKKCWRLANTPQISKALNNAYWHDLGLVSLLDRYHKLRVIV
jgi:RNA-directed DNA polymerase